jgi:hypothetical protein
VSGYNGSLDVGQDLDSDNNNVLDSTPWSTVVDTVCVDKSGAETTYSDAICIYLVNPTMTAVFRSDQGVVLHAGVSGSNFTNIRRDITIVINGEKPITPGSVNNIPFGDGKVSRIVWY